jgi:YidC/Oxa1 family membrane protein insertase
MTQLFQTIFYEPILNLVVFLYSTVSFQDLGIAIVFLTIIIKILLLPLSKQAIKSQKAMQDIQPKISQIKKEYAGKKEEMGQALMKLYKDNKVNPFSSCLPLLIQLPFLWAVFRVFRDDPGQHLDLVYGFLSRFRPETIDQISLGFINLAEPNYILAILAGGAQFWQAKMMLNKKKKLESGDSKEEGIANMMGKQMLYFMPIITIFIGVTLPGGVTLYWFILTLLTALQQLYVMRGENKKEDI